MWLPTRHGHRLPSLRCSIGGALWGAAMLLSVVTIAAADGVAADRSREFAGPAGTMRLIGLYPQERGLGHTVTALPDGRILVYGHSPGPQSIDAVQLDPRRRTSERNTIAPVVWDPRQRDWRTLDNPPECQFTHYLHTATALPGNRILIAGGLCDGPRPPGTDPADRAYRALSIWNDATGKWEAAPALLDGRIYHTATALADGSVIIVGGEKDTRTGKDTEPVLSSVEIYSDQGVTPAQPMQIARAHHTATRLTDGSVMVVGGMDSSGRAIANVEIWNSMTRRWSPGPALKTARYRHSATLLADGRVLVAGGIDRDGLDTASVEILDASRSAWQPAAPLLLPLRRHSAMELANGDVLVVGINFDGEYSPPRAFPMLWSKSTGGWRPAGHLDAERYKDTQSYLLVPLHDQKNRALVFDFRQIMLWSPSAVGPSNRAAYAPRAGYATARLKDGRVMLVGGRHWLRDKPEGATGLDWAEIVDPATGEFSLTGRLTQPFRQPRALVLNDGKVVVAGVPGSDRLALFSGKLKKGEIWRLGEQAGYFAEWWNPKTGEWRVVPGASVKHVAATRFENMAALDDGRVMFLVSNYQESDAGQIRFSAVFWDPATNRTLVRNVRAKGRSGAGSAITPDGKVIVLGGHKPGKNDAIWDGEIWDSQTGRTEQIPMPPGWKTSTIRSLVLANRNVFWMDLGYPGAATGPVAVWNSARRYWQSLPLYPRGKDWWTLRSPLIELQDGTVVADTLWLRPGATAWAPIPRFPQVDGTLVPMRDGKILAVSTMAPHLASFDPESRNWRVSARHYLRRTDRARPVLAELTDGRLMVAGRLENTADSKETVAQIWDPGNDSWSSFSRLVGDYAEAAQAVLLPSGQVMHLGLDREGRFQCEIGHPADSNWKNCGASAPETRSRRAFSVGTMRDGSVVLKFSGGEIYLYKESTGQWMTGDRKTFQNTEAKWTTDGFKLPDGCLVNGPPVRIQNISTKAEVVPVVPVTGIYSPSATMVMLRDGTVAIAGKPEAANDFNNGFFHRKVTCAGFDARDEDQWMMVSKTPARPLPDDSESAPVPVPVTDWNPFRDITDRIAWIVLVLLGTVVLYFILRRVVQRVNELDPGQSLSPRVAGMVRLAIFGLIGISVYMLLPRNCSPPGKWDAASRAGETNPCRYVGKWSSTRVSGVYIINLYDDGRYSTDPVKFGRGPAHVYHGRWGVIGDKMVWHNSGDSANDKDVNPILQETEGAFTLMEQNGEYSRFELVEKLDKRKCSPK